MSRDLIVLSHLQWAFVWQRPQHLISRLGATYDRTWFVDEPIAGSAEHAVLRTVDAGHVTRVVLELPAGEEPSGFDGKACDYYIDALPRVLGDAQDATVWLYTPMALDVARRLRPSLLVYDVMDDLAAFKFAAPELVLRQRQALRQATVVFTGGRSLHRGVVDQRPDAHCFPSGVEPDHYARAVELRAQRDATRPVAGYVGVIDERLDLPLLAGLADELPDWQIEVVGPVVKIDPDDLPVRDNLSYPGSKPYGELPSVMGGFDVALMPFALNEATRSISPTKTLEYLAAGLPVVSTRVPDVVSEFGSVVDLQDDATSFAEACRRVAAHDVRARDREIEPLLHANHWDTIAARMGELLDHARLGEVAQGTPA